MRNIYLVGFMGTGKTCVGKELAREKRWQFVDLDELIQLKEKRVIADIFAQEGEPYFRRLEARVLKEVAREKGFVTTLMNRRRYLPDIQNNNRSVRQFAERIAVNAPIQGTAADLIKMAMINIHRRLIEKKRQTQLILQIHDELVFEVPEKELNVVRALVKEEMEGVMRLAIPLKVEIGVGKNWAEAH